MVSKCCWPAGNTSCLRERHRLRESVSTVGSHHSMGPHPKASFLIYINRWAQMSGGEGFTSIWKHTYTHDQLHIHKHMHHNFSDLAASVWFTVCHHMVAGWLTEVCHRLTVGGNAKLVWSHDPRDIMLTLSTNTNQLTSTQTIRQAHMAGGRWLTATSRSISSFCGHRVFFCRFSKCFMKVNGKVRI